MLFDIRKNHLWGGGGGGDLFSLLVSEATIHFDYGILKMLEIKDNFWHFVQESLLAGLLQSLFNILFVSTRSELPECLYSFDIRDTYRANPKPTQSPPADQC